MRHINQQAIRLLTLGAILVTVGCASRQQVLPASQTSQVVPDPYYTTPYPLVVETQPVPCRVPDSAALAAWAQAAGGDVYHQRQVDIQVHDRSIHCSLSERAGSYYGEPLPSTPHYHPPRYNYYYPSYRYRYPY